MRNSRPIPRVTGAGAAFVLLAALVTALSVALWLPKLEPGGTFVCKPPRGFLHDDSGVGGVAGALLLETAEGCCTNPNM